jgi:hypothetical protein
MAMQNWPNCAKRNSSDPHIKSLTKQRNNRLARRPSNSELLHERWRAFIINVGFLFHNQHRQEARDAIFPEFSRGSQGSQSIPGSIENFLYSLVMARKMKNQTV